MCSADVTSVQSANVVGFQNITHEDHAAAQVGATFIPLNGAESYKLKELTVKGESEWDYMNPDTEYLQDLDPATTEVKGRYAYLSKEYCDGELDGEESYDLIGWREFERLKTVSDHAGKKEWNRDEVDITVGQALLGKISPDARIFTSAGQVAMAPTQIEADDEAAKFILNYLPVDKKLKKFIVEGENEWDYMNPDLEYFQELDPSTTEVKGRYTYLSKEYCDNDLDGEASYDLIGWWEYERGKTVSDHAGKQEWSRDEVTFKSGFGYLGKISPDVRIIKVPGALD